MKVRVEPTGGGMWSVTLGGRTLATFSSRVIAVRWAKLMAEPLEDEPAR
jgi:hypothetical protein